MTDPFANRASEHVVSPVASAGFSVWRDVRRHFSGKSKCREVKSGSLLTGNRR
jgi:hypothetical protein